jgi:uncharacterized circularly permuted ATP-grasp superfamily protein
MQRLESPGPGDLQNRVHILDSIFRSLGITFAVYGGKEGTERTWPMDLVPRIIPAASGTVSRRASCSG